MTAGDNGRGSPVKVSLEVLYNPERLLTTIKFDFARTHRIPADQIYFEGIVCCQSAVQPHCDEKTFCLLNLCLQGVDWDYQR